MSQPKALFLADVMHNDPCSAAHHDAAAFELRRLHAENEAMVELVKELVAQRDALLEALKEVADALEIASNGGGVDFYQYAKETRAAIKAVEEGK